MNRFPCPGCRGPAGTLLTTGIAVLCVSFDGRAGQWLLVCCDMCAQVHYMHSGHVSATPSWTSCTRDTNAIDSSTQRGEADKCGR